jgi:hypothetical protein
VYSEVRDSNPPEAPLIENQIVLHTFNVVALMNGLWDWSSVDKERKDAILAGYALHDVGKFDLPLKFFVPNLDTQLLTIPGQYQRPPAMEAHPLVGEKMLHNALIKVAGDGIVKTYLYQRVCNSCMNHHALPRNNDDRGYPAGINYENMDEYDFALSILDRFEAITANANLEALGLPYKARAYNGGESPYRAIHIIEAELGNIGFFGNEKIELQTRDKIRILLNRLRELDKNPEGPDDLSKHGINLPKYSDLVNHAVADYPVEMFTNNRYVKDMLAEAKKWQMIT